MNSTEKKFGIEALLSSEKGLTILEAGCGSMTHFPHPDRAHIVGIDISQDQLDKCDYLHEKLLGDLETYPLPDSHFDIIVCWDVLEHLRKPQLALANFARAVKPGGFVFLASPNVLTLRGLLTKFTPHFVHVWYYRYWVGHADAGKPGTWPFKSYHRFVIAPPVLKRLAERNGLEVERLSYANWEMTEHRSGLFMAVWKPLNTLVSFLSFGIVGTDQRMGFQLTLKRPFPPSPGSTGQKHDNTLATSSGSSHGPTKVNLNYTESGPTLDFSWRTLLGRTESHNRPW